LSQYRHNYNIYL